MKFNKIAAILMASVMTAGAATVMGAAAAKESSSSPAVRAMKGDINGDTDIDIEDLQAVTWHVKGIKAIPASRLARADVNWDGKVDVTDISLISYDINGISPIRSGNVLGRSYVTNEDLDAIIDYINGVDPLTKAERTRADLNKDGKINVTDAVLLSRYLYVR
ncbi:MAG: dockerin type I repeat-containing protein [Ruminococcus sp.]|uniref:dockerin type I repeat-containing protein n=1 Tax=Ruminococcus flavefaciens TaxID=1265 RepID=UPI0026F098FA|nr:dockerin type I repeat-containing protein [Ruminococcus flavefaciens]MBQ6035577.1 dockerin type I repeat-containing protein [Ruminococcus sp.]